MKKTLAIICMVCMLIGVIIPASTVLAADVWDGTTTDTQWSGTGTAADPYLITSAAELAGLSNQVKSVSEYSGTYFRLETDIDLAKKDWMPIGCYTSNGNMRYFRGIFDGNGKVIKNLSFTTFKDSTDERQGLFGTVSSASIRNLGVENVTGYIHVWTYNGNTGGLIGNAAGTTTVDNCFVKNITVTVATTNAFSIGGLIGGFSGTSVTNCYTYNVNVSCSAGMKVAGLLGSSSGTITNCYAAKVTVSSTSSPAAFAGSSTGTVTNCYYTDSNKTDVYAVSKTTNELMLLGSVLGSSFVNVPDSNINNGYPILKWQIPSGYYAVTAALMTGGTVKINPDRIVTEGETVTVTPVPNTEDGRSIFYVEQVAYNGTVIEPVNGVYSFTMPVANVTVTVQFISDYDVWDGTTTDTQWSGTGTAADPYLITSAAELAGLSNQVKSVNEYSGTYFRLETDIDLNNKDWQPIGCYLSNGNVRSFRGIFDGNGKVIKNLSFTTSTYSTDERQGLFGSTYSAAVRNLGIINVSGYIHVYTYNGNTGGLIGNAAGTTTVDNCFVKNITVTVATTNAFSIGGLIGGFSGTSVTNCYTYNVNVSCSAGMKVAGLLGSSTGTITNCYAAKVTVSSTSSPAAFAGSSTGTVTNCYYTDSNKTDVYAVSKTAEELMSLAPVLGSAFINVPVGINSGYPILTWYVPAGYYAVTAAEMTGGTVTVSPDEIVTEGTVITVTPVANTGWSIGSMYYNGVEIVPANGVYSFTMPAENVTLTAVFSDTFEGMIEGFVINNHRGVVDDNSRTVTVYQPESSGVTSLSPVITLGTGCTISPESGVACDFTNPVIYTLTKNGEMVNYTVTVKTYDGTNIDISWYSPTDTSMSISNARQLAGLAALVSKGCADNTSLISYIGGDKTAAAIDISDDFNGKTITLTSDIDWTGREWLPIGTNNGAQYPFKGLFDGGGHVISNITYENNTALSLGVFGLVLGDSSRISNLGIKNASFTSSKSGQLNMGALIGVSGRDTSGIEVTPQIENCYVKDSKVINTGNSNWARIGGLTGGSVGVAINDCYIINSTVSGENTLVGTAVAGFGDVYSGRINNCYAGDVTVICGAGFGYYGFSNGAFTGCTITNCYSEGNNVDSLSAGSLEKKLLLDWQKCSDVTALLGDGFKNDKYYYINNGYPLLSWEEYADTQTVVNENCEAFKLYVCTSIIQSDIYLPDSYNQIAVTWSDPTGVIANDGTLNAPLGFGTTDVTLTATFTAEGCSQSKSFDLAVQDKTPCTIDDLLMRDSSGNQVYSLSSGGEVVSADVTVNDSSLTNKALIVALYNDDVLADSKVLQVTESGTYPIGIAVTEGNESYRLKVFLWNSTNMSPYANTKKIFDKCLAGTKIYTAGDSIVANHSVGSSIYGWGECLGNYFDSAYITVDNSQAAGGRTTASFIEEGRLSNILNSLNKGDYLFVHFAYNDMRVMGVDAYKRLLNQYIDTARSKGAVPVFVTSPETSDAASDTLSGGSYVVTSTLSGFPEAMKEVAAEYDAPVIDLNQKVRDYMAKNGKTALNNAGYYYSDTVHFTATGANWLCGLITEEIRNIQLPVADYTTEN